MKVRCSSPAMGERPGAEHRRRPSESVAGQAFPSLRRRRPRRRALVRAVTAATPGWSVAERHTVAALLDVLWNLPSYERLVGVWNLGGEDASRAIAWMMTKSWRPSGGAT